MRTNRETITIFQQTVLYFFLIFFSLGCGGGTRGTGGVEFIGKVITPSSAPLSNVEVTLVGTGLRALTTSDGGFTLSSPVQGEPLFQLTSQARAVRVSVAGLSPNASQVELTIEVDFGRGTARVKELKETRQRRDDDRDDDGNDDGSDSEDGSDDDGDSEDEDDDGDEDEDDTDEDDDQRDDDTEVDDDMDDD